ncbi:MAG: TIGR03032 family protein [Methylovulum miyakonense]|uniref:TIGR03032 family protein n=1 Tax=Methylovulum miyakonense TaxID=645578 RepID=UPI003BB63649
MSIPFASQHTPSFPALLNFLGASVLVSTYQAGQLIILRTQEDVLNTHFCGLEKPMGIAAYKERLAVGTGYQLWEYANLPAVGQKMAGPAVHDACYLPRSVHITGDIDIHEMAYSDEGELWLVNTRMSCLCTLDPAYSVVPRWRPPFVTAYDLSDRCHLNGMALKNGKPAFVTALGKTDTAAGWRANKASGGLLMGVPDGRIITAGLSMPHSPRWYQNKLWYLESGAGQLCTVNPNSGVRTVIAQVPGFTRGLDFVGRYAFIGLSQVRETAIFSGLPLTSQTGERHCGVWVVDIENGQTVACVAFTGSVQEVFAVQVLPHRFPVLLDMDDPLVRSSYSLPDEALAEVATPEPLTLAFEAATQQHSQGNLEAAIDAYRQLLSQASGHIPARFHLGVALADLERWQEGEEELSQLLALQPNHAEAHNSLGLCFAGQENWAKALHHYGQAITADQQYAVAHMNRAMILLKLGRMDEGWAEYEWRWQTPAFTPFACPQPRWQGEDIGGKILLVHTEQGAGDALQFARFLPLAAVRCKKLILVCTEALRPLLANCEGVAEARLPGNVALDSFDYLCPLLSLPHILGIGLHNLPAAVPYVHIPAHITVPRLGGQGFKVGICWAGSHTHQNDRHRSCPLPNWLPLLSVSDTTFYSLQTPLPIEDADFLNTHNIINLEPELTDYARTAALIRQLDLVISVDTSIVHLAGALGKPAWLLLGQHSDWRWLLDREDSVWYPDVKLIRQTQAGDWGELMGRLILNLRAWKR